MRSVFNPFDLLLICRGKTRNLGELPPKEIEHNRLQRVGIGLHIGYSSHIGTSRDKQGETKMTKEIDYTKPAGVISEIFLDGAAHEASGLDIASAVLAQLHPVLHTSEEVNALPMGSVVLDAFGASCTKVRSGSIGWRRVTPAVAGGEGHWHGPYLPATVLHEGDASTRPKPSGN